MAFPVPWRWRVALWLYRRTVVPLLRLYAPHSPRWRCEFAAELLRAQWPGDPELRLALELLRVRWLHDPAGADVHLTHIGAALTAIGNRRMAGDMIGAEAWRAELRSQLIAAGSARG